MVTFGNTIIEPQSVTWDSWWGFQYNVAENGVIKSITAYWGDAGDYHIGIYGDDTFNYPENLLVETGVWTRPAAGWQTKVVADTPFSAGKIWIIAGQDASINTAQINGHLSVQDQALRGFRLAASYGAMPNPMTHGGTTNAHDCSIYATYTPSGGVTVKKGSVVPAMTALLSKFSALKQPRQPRFQSRTLPKFTPRTLI